jgi:regulator of ribonuclease activity A
MNDIATADLFDAHGDSVRSCELQFHQYGARRRFSGRIRTLQTVEDNALLKQTLSGPGGGGVLVVDGGGSLRCALVGDVIAALAQKNGWAGLVIWGAVRDTNALAGVDVGIKALGSNPRRSQKNGTGQLDVAIRFGAVEFRTGNWLYSDEDGILISDRKLT